MSELLLQRRFRIELKNGNAGRGGHWGSKKGDRDRIAAHLLRLGETRQPFDVPVKLVVTRILGPKQACWDADSILRGNAKELIDSLVEVGWFHDDSPKYITEVIGRQCDQSRDDGPAVDVEVWSA